MAQLRREEKQFKVKGAQVILVGLGSPDEAESFRKELKLGFPIICDPERRLYAAYGLKKMGLLGFASPLLLVKGVQALAQGHSMAFPSGDIHQLPGVFIIDTAGRIRFSHYARNPADHPSIDIILATLSAINN